MTDLRKAAENLIKIVDDTPYGDFEMALSELRQALAQPKQKGHCTCGEPEALGVVHFRTRPCFHYIHQPKREWVGLTDEEVEAWRGNYDFFDSALVRKVEAKLKEKNT